MSDTHARLREALTAIARDYPKTLTPARHPTTDHTTGVSAALPLSASVLDTRAKAHIRLAKWARLVIVAQKLHRTGPAGVQPLCAFLITHTDTLAKYPNALTDLEHSATDLTQIVAGNAPARFDVGPCPGKDCTGVLRAVVRRDDDLLPSQLSCNGMTTHSWPTATWRTLERVMHMNEKAARRMAEAIAHPPV